MNYSYKKIIALLLLCTEVASFAAAVPPSALDESAAEASVEDSLGYFSEEGDTAGSAAERPTSGVWIFVRMILVLAVIIAAIYLLFRFMRKSMGVEPASADDIFLRKVSFISLGGSKSVQIVSLWNKAYVLGVSDEGVTLISEIDDREMIDAMNRYADMNDTEKKPRTFEEILDIFTNRAPSRRAGEQPRRPKRPRKKSAYDSETMNLINALKEKLTGNKAEAEDAPSPGSSEGEAGDAADAETGDSR